MRKLELTKEQLERASDYHALFTSELGRRVLEDMRRAYGDRRSYVDGDPHATSFREGQRDVYLAILDLLAIASNPSRVIVVEGAPEEDE